MSFEKKIEIAAFYKFTRLSSNTIESLKNDLLKIMEEESILGTIILAPDGVNSTIAGPRESIDFILNRLNLEPNLDNIKAQYSFAETIPFSKAKIKIKTEILTFKEKGLPPITELTGTFVSPQDWNNVITDPEVLLIDTRNTYETEVGTFQGAVDPKTETFIEFKDYVRKNLDPKKHKRVAMFCTGGIRCERASNFMLQEGFNEIYQLKGGITSYLREIKETESLWQGNCFIFDDRRELTHELVSATAQDYKG